MKFDNSQGKIFYGMHFYPGVARYETPNTEALTVFINENTIRKMGPSFSGRPVFVEHVDDVNQNLGELRSEADGWVVESFYNAKDGKTWAKFIIVSERGLQAISEGYRLSNAYIPKSFDKGGFWNGVEYQKEVTMGEFEHLAIVKNPRYEESIIMTPEEFKTYNEENEADLKRLANSKDKKGDQVMKFFKKTKVENSVDTSMSVELPKSKKEVTLEKMINEYDAILNMNGYANGDHMVKVGDKDEMSVNDLVKKHLEAMNEIEEFKKPKNDDAGDEESAGDMDENDSEAEQDEAGKKDVADRGGDKSLDNEDEDEEKEDKKKEKKQNSMTVDEAKKVLAKEKARKLKNANFSRAEEESISIQLPGDQVALGKQRYGSGN